MRKRKVLLGHLLRTFISAPILDIVVFNVTLDAGQVKTLGAGFERALSVNRNGKLTVTWGIIKTERN